MTTTGFVQTRWLTFTLHLVLAALAVHQGLASVAPQKEPGRPLTGHYQVTGTNGSVCLLAHMGLQLNISFNSTSSNQTVHVVNLEPNATEASGSCDSDSAMLRLSTDTNKTNLTFFFVLNVTSNKYHLSEISLSANWTDMKEPFSARNNSLDYLRGTLGFSYMCHEEQTLNVVQALSINTFQLQVQPFNVTQNKFGTAEHCQLDEDDMLIAIVVGAALAGLVLIVLVAYLIGRRRSHAGSCSSLGKRALSLSGLSHLRGGGDAERKLGSSITWNSFLENSHWVAARNFHATTRTLMLAGSNTKSSQNCWMPSMPILFSS